MDEAGHTAVLADLLDPPRLPVLGVRLDRDLRPPPRRAGRAARLVGALSSLASTAAASSGSSSLASSSASSTAGASRATDIVGAVVGLVTAVIACHDDGLVEVGLHLLAGRGVHQDLALPELRLLH